MPQFGQPELPAVPGQSRIRATMSSFLKRVLGVDPKLRYRGRLPEEIPAQEAKRLLETIRARFPRVEHPLTGKVTYPISTGRIVPDTSEGAVIGLTRQVEETRRLMKEVEAICDPCDDAQPFADLINTDLNSLAIEFSHEPSETAVDTWLEALLGEELVHGDGNGELGGHVRKYMDAALLDESYVVKPEDLVKCEKFEAFTEQATCMLNSWKAYKDKPLFSRRLLHLRRSIECASEGVETLFTGLEELGWERECLKLEYLTFQNGVELPPEPFEPYFASLADTLDTALEVVDRHGLLGAVELRPILSRAADQLEWAVAPPPTSGDDDNHNDHGDDDDHDDHDDDYPHDDIEELLKLGMEQGVLSQKTKYFYFRKGNRGELKHENPEVVLDQIRGDKKLQGQLRQECGVGPPAGWTDETEVVEETTEEVVSFLFKDEDCDHSDCCCTVRIDPHKEARRIVTRMAGTLKEGASTVEEIEDDWDRKRKWCCDEAIEVDPYAESKSAARKPGA